MKNFDKLLKTIGQMENKEQALKELDKVKQIVANRYSVEVGKEFKDFKNQELYSNE